MSRACARLAIVATLSLATGCGSSYTPDTAKRRDAAPLASVYDILVSVPTMSFPQLSATGLLLDLTLEIDPLGPAAAGDFTGRATVNRVAVGGVDRPFAAAVPLAVTGRVSGSEWSLDSFGPVLVGSPATGQTFVTISLNGMVSPDGRAIDGAALVTSSGETGTFTAVKQRRYLVAGTDFGVTGTVSLIRVRFNDTFVVDRDVEAVSGDPVVRSSGNGVFVVNRFFFDNVQSLDPASGYATAVQFSTGNGSNPHDALAVDPNRLYITRYEPPYNDVLIADPSDGRTIGWIDLSPLASNASGTPRADGLAMAEGRVFVGLQNIDAAFLDYGPGLVAVIDPGTDGLVRAIRMTGRNPFGPPARHPASGNLYYAMAGVFQGSLTRELSGGIEVVDPAALGSLGLLVDDDDLGGNVSGVTLSGDSGSVTGYCIVTDASGANAVRAFDPATGAVRPGAVYASASFLPEIVADGDGYVLVAEHDVANPRIVVLDGTTGRIVASIRMSLPPFSVAVLTRGIAGS